MARIPSKVNRDALRKARQFISALKSNGLTIQAAYLYGSHARGTAREWSDIDIAVVARNLSGNWHNDFLSLARVSHTIDSRIEAIGYIPRTFRDESPLVWEIKTTGIQLVGNGKNGKRRASRKRAAPKSPRRA